MSSNNDANPRDVSPYQLFVLALSIAALLSLAARAIWEPDPEARTVLDSADVVVCAFFFIDFLISLYTAPRRLVYLATWGWIDLLSSIPAIDTLRWGCAARIFRILRVLRAVKAMRVLGSVVVERRAQSVSWRRSCSRCCCSFSRRSPCSSSKRAAMETSGMPRTRCGGPSPR